MAIIRTVLGDIPPEQLGYTSVHEHTISDNTKLGPILLRSMPDMLGGVQAYQNGLDVQNERQRRTKEHLDMFPAMSIGGVLKSMHSPKDSPAGRLPDLEYYTNELKAYYAVGGRSICDCSPTLSCKTDLSVLQKLSNASGVQIVSAVGYYIRPSIAKELWKAGERALRQKIDDYLEYGDRTCSARPGLIKCAVSALEHGELSTPERLALLACANAAHDTGMSLHIHTAFPVRRAQIRQIADELEHILTPEKVIFCHMDSYNLGPGNPSAIIGENGYDATFPAEIAGRGFHIGLDTWSIGAEDASAYRFQLQAREQLLLDLISRGLINQITLGHDFMTKANGIQMGRMGYTEFPTALARLQKENCLNSQQVRTLTVTNPAKLLAF